MSRSSFATAAAVDLRHKWIFTKVAQSFGIEITDIETFVTLRQSSAILMNIEEFLRQGGTSRLIFLFDSKARQMKSRDRAMTGFHFRWTLKTVDTAPDALEGPCCYFLRLRPDEVTEKNMDDIVTFGQVDEQLLQDLQHGLSNVYFPIIFQENERLRNQFLSKTTHVIQEGGPLANGDKPTRRTAEPFLDGLRKFSDIIKEADACLREIVHLELPQQEFHIKDDPTSIGIAATNPEIIGEYERILKSWYRKIEQLLAECEQLRLESDDIGPSAELEYWRSRMAKFNSVTEQLRSPGSKVVLKVLTEAKSKTVHSWSVLESKIIDGAVEAKDNVKYLYTLEKYTEPLERSNPVEALEIIPGLINAIALMHSVARYYNTAERMTELLSKVTNQLVKCCRNHIIHGNYTSIWSYVEDHGESNGVRALLQRFKDCIHLNEVYQSYYRQTKEQRRRHPEHRQFDFSEVAIFGKFDQFVRRLKKLVELFHTIDQFNSLSKCTVEGIDAILSKFNEILNGLRQKPYDHLDFRHQDFELDYREFSARVQALEVTLTHFINSCFDAISGKADNKLDGADEEQNDLNVNIPGASGRGVSRLDHAFKLLEQFQGVLQRENLREELESKYRLIFSLYGSELDHVKALYDRHKERPPMPRNSPPVAGNIAWARQLQWRIEQPMKLLQSYPQILQMQEARKAIRVYNKLASTLVQFETLWHRSWCKAVNEVRAGLNATLLVRHPTTGKLFVNFDRQIIMLIRETKRLQRLEVEVPPTARFICMQEDRFKAHHNELSYMLERYTTITESVPKILEPLMGPLRRDVEAKIEPGLTSLSWTSINVDAYIQAVYASLNKLDEVASKANGILRVRIYGILRDIQQSNFFHLSSTESTDIEAFIEHNKSHAQSVAVMVDQKSLSVENAVFDLLELVTGTFVDTSNGLPTPATPRGLLTPRAPSRPRSKIGDPQSPSPRVQRAIKVQEEMRELVENLKKHFHERLYESLLDSVLYSYRALHLRLSSRMEYVQRLGEIGVTAVETQVPLFQIVIDLKNSEIMMTPSMEDITECFASVSTNMLLAIKNVKRWYQDRTKIQHEVLPNYYSSIARNREVMRAIIYLTAALQGSRSRIREFIASLQRFEAIWNGTEGENYEAFIAGAERPGLTDYENELRRLDQVEREIADIDGTETTFFLRLDVETLKKSVQAETRHWMRQYGKIVHDNAETELERLISFMDETTEGLSKTIVDLEDVKEVMQALAEVRKTEVEMELTIGPIEDAFSLLEQFHIQVSMEVKEKVDNLGYRWKKLKDRVAKVTTFLIEKQPEFKADLIDSVKAFVKDVANFALEYDTRGPMVQGIKPKVAVERLKVFQRGFEDRDKKWKTYSSNEQLFGLAVTQYPELVKIEKELKLLGKLYGLYTAVIDTIDGYEEVLWVELDFDSINNQITDFQNKCRRLPKQMKDWEAYIELKNKIDDFVETLPLLRMLADKAVIERHWKKLMEITGVTFKLDWDSITLRSIVQMPLLKYYEDVEEVANAAVKEADIEVKMEKIKEEWVDTVFEFAQYKNRGLLLLNSRATAELITKLDDSIMVLGSLMSNRFNAPFKKEIQEWVKRLTTASEVIEQWLIVQNLWVYLEAVFMGGDIARQLPMEAKQFSNIDKSWGKIVAAAQDNPKVIYVCYQDESLRNILPHLNKQLEQCQKSLSGYLETKRDLFPRFYFVSDPALLEILGQASDPSAIQPHLKSIFDNLARVTFDKHLKNNIVTMSSSEGESIPMVALTKPILAEGNIEDWLSNLEKGMRYTMKTVVRDAASQLLQLDLEEFIWKYPAQVALLGLQLLWTFDCTDALVNAKTDKTAMSTANKKVARVMKDLVDLIGKDLEKLERRKIETLITIQVHQRDVFDSLVKAKVKSHTDFEWLKQTRFYWKNDQDECIISITDVDFEYCYEFLGCTERLVITPLTDRCYITLAQALGLYLGGAPAGPAGTGKTETTKDMGRTLGKFVVVFNCSDQMDFRGLGKIYKGLAQSGAWGCFDEFNRIHLEVLSVAAQQVQCILTAIREHKDRFQFIDGTVLNLDDKCGFFITMNPGYAGRQELPENLKALFRSVAMMVPDRQIIMRVKLAAAGFQENDVLAKKFFILYKLCEEQLSKQRHYDFGLRNILSVLRTLGPAKRSGGNNQTETQIFMRVVRDMNLSKLIAEDEPLFLSLINDLFPGQVIETNSYPDLDTAIREAVEEDGRIDHPDWHLKVIQLYETASVRWGIMVLGTSQAGKTQCINVLMRALTATGQPHKGMKMNPKAITATQMFGRLDVATNDWTDGIFSALWRKACKRKEENTWLTLDGPVDAIWIENLNTVLDDNKTLTLANGDRIPMSPLLKLIFEVENLNNASPATVSRAGMIYMSPTTLGWRPILASWLKDRSEEEKGVINSTCEKVVDSCLAFIRDDAVMMMHCQEINLMQTVLLLLEAFIEKAKVTASGTLSRDHLTRLVVLSISWGLGGLLESKDRKRLHYFMSNMGIDMPRDALEQSDDNTTDSIFECYVDDSGLWQHWITNVPKYQYPSPSDGSPDFHTIHVPTVDSVRCEFLIDSISGRGRNVLLIGESGSAKSVTVEQHLRRQDTEEMLSKAVNFSSATTPLLLQKTIEGTVEKRIGNTYGPPGNKQMTILIDDINMPEVNEWGDQVTNELVRQLMEEKGFYNLDKPGEFTGIVDLQFIATMCHPGGGRNDIPGRLKGHYAIFNLTMPGDKSIDEIYGSILIGHFCEERGFTDEVINVAGSMARLTRIIWEKTKRKMLPTPSKFHYIFNLRDLSRITQGVISVTPDVCRSAVDLLQLWRHEADRVLADKLVSESDRAWFRTAVEDLLRNEYSAPLGDEAAEKKYYVNFLRDAMEVEDALDDNEELPEAPKIYEPAESMEALRNRVKFFMEQHNEANKRTQLNLVLFDDALHHLMRISRILGTPRGNALLVGVGGSGKQSLTRLSSFIAGNKVFQIILSKAYTAASLLEDFKNIYITVGVQNQPATFLFTDNEIKDDSFLEYINMFLSSGEITGMLQKDEVESIVSDLRPVLKKTLGHGFLDTNDNIYKWFIDHVRNNLHLVLCFSPVGDKFRRRSQKFPAVINNCTIDWFMPWPQQALWSVANEFLSTFTIDADAAAKAALVDHMGACHNTVNKLCSEYFDRMRRHVYVTPKTFLNFIKGYKNMYSDKVGEIDAMRTRLQHGLTKLEEAEKEIAHMKIELVDKEKNLNEAQRKLAVLLEEIKESTKIAETKKAEVLEQKEKLSARAEIIEGQKREAEQDLAAAEPALRAAVDALNAITPAHISVIKRLASPPNLIKRIMDGVLILRRLPVVPFKKDSDITDKDLPVASWQCAISMIGDSQFLNTLLEYPRDNIDDEMCELLMPYLDMPDFNVEAARKSCGDLAGVCTWVRAMVEYHNIAKVVEPKRVALAAAESNLKAALKELKTAEDDLAQREAELDKMKAKLDDALDQKRLLEEDMNSTKKRMGAANALINGLADEKVRWSAQIVSFSNTVHRLVGDVALAQAFLSYAGPFNRAYRNEVLKACIADLRERRVPSSYDGLRIVKFLCDDNKIGEWNLQGLPTDEYSSENGILVTQARNYPLLIDPQGQGKNWIKNKETRPDMMLRVTNLSDKHFRQKLEDTIQYGLPLLIEDLEEELDPLIDPLLEKQFVKSGKNLQLRVGDKEVIFAPEFKLYMTTKLPNPHYSPEIASKTCMIDFTVTMDGLEEQLLGRVIAKEMSHLEQERRALQSDVQNNKRRGKELADELLDKLSNVEGSLLDDLSLIDMLAQTKKTAEEISEKIESAEIKEKQINDAREEFRSVATRGAILYFLIADLRMVNTMYQTSLQQFLVQFDESIDKAEQARPTKKRVANIIDVLTYTIYKYISQGLFEQHKLIYALLMAIKIDMQAGHISSQEFSIFVKCGAGLDLSVAESRPNKYPWLQDNVWLNLLALSDIQRFRALPDVIERNKREWREWCGEEAPEIKPLPDVSFEEQLDPFRRLLMVRAWREDRTMLAASSYIAASLGQRYLQDVPLKLDQVIAETSAVCPIIFLLSPGSDPTAAIDAHVRKLKKRILRISMGQGQEVQARKYISQGLMDGSWVLLQNCHLGLGFLSELQGTLSTIASAAEEKEKQSTGMVTKTEESREEGGDGKKDEDATASEKKASEVPTAHPEFRVWVTSEPHDKFPIGLLQMSLKLTNEPPSGIKAGLNRSYAWLDQDMLEAVNKPQWAPLLYTMCFLHTTVQERRKFGPIGWNVPYEFNQSDLSASVEFLQKYFYSGDIKKGITWSTIRYMICEVMYGGRITDDFDRRLMNTYGTVWFDNGIFNPSFAFHEGYSIPNSRNITEVIQHIDNLARDDKPEVFGLHANADISYRGQQAKAALSTILSVQPKDTAGGAGGETREDIVLRITQDLASKLPPDFVPKEIKQNLQRHGQRRPLIIFLRQEIERMQKVISTVRRSLKDLQLAIAGTIIMNESLRQTLDALYDGTVPPPWLHISWAASGLSFWFAELVKRAEQFEAWLCGGGSPKAFWLTGFFNPQGFLTAMRQETTRAHQGWSLDSVVLKTEVTRFEKEDIKSSPEDGVYVYGLYLEGAGWEKKSCRLVEATPKILSVPMPVIHITATNAPKFDPRTYKCPVYRSPKRTIATWVFDVTLPTDDVPLKWIIRGVALLCTIN